jgi:hypothetical protein
MKYFADYLIEKQVLTAEVVVKALVEQISHTPAPAIVVAEGQWMPAADLYRILKYQSEKNLEFIQAAQEIGLWTPEYTERLVADTKKARIPLGEILVKNKALTLSQLIKAVDEFLSRKQGLDLETKNSALDLKEFEDSNLNSIDFEILQELTFFLNGPKLESWKKVAADLANPEVGWDRKKLGLHELLITFHTLLGIVQFAKLRNIEKIAIGRESATVDLLKVVEGADGSANVSGKVNDQQWQVYSHKALVFFDGMESLVQNFIDGHGWNHWVQQYSQSKEFFGL